MDKHGNKHQVNLHNQKIANRSVHCCAEKSRTLQKSSNQVFEYFVLCKCEF
jgi:hypothetical protein